MHGKQHIDRHDQDCRSARQPVGANPRAASAAKASVQAPSGSMIHTDRAPVILTMFGNRSNGEPAEAQINSPQLFSTSR